MKNNTDIKNVTSLSKESGYLGFAEDEVAVEKIFPQISKNQNMEKTMTKNEAVEKLQEGYLVTHEGWKEGEHLYVEDGKLFNEEAEETNFAEALTVADGWTLVESDEEPEPTMTIEEAHKLMGEHPKGRNGMPKERALQIFNLRKLGYSNKQVAAKFNTTYATIKKITDQTHPYENLLEG